MGEFNVKPTSRNILKQEVIQRALYLDIRNYIAQLIKKIKHHK